MGVAGDGQKGLEKEWDKSLEMGKSKTMSAKNAWGKSTGYANTLIEQGMEATRAQQVENWRNQREVKAQRDEHRWMTDEFDRKTDEDWRSLSTFGGEQVGEVNLDAELGEVRVGDVTGVIELSGRINQAQVFEFSIKNPFMGFSDFRARFTQMTSPADWSVTPTEGSLNGRGDPTQFMVKFRPQNPSLSEGYLVVETEEDKWTYKLVGTASM
jgi:predicted fused transcriptional regulator/phosphomethylpyrimidine kinase